jgi:glycosyltransferase involved in cell wall biosynthesis
MRCLYIIYWGATEPIGMSGPIPTVIELAAHHGEEVFLVTFDKPDHFADEARRRLVEERLSAQGIRWKNLGYTKWPPNLSTLFDGARGVVFCAWWVARYDIPVVHARTFVGSAIGAVLRTCLPIRLVGHPDGFWPDERVDNGVWKRDATAHRWALAIERFVYRRSDQIIVLSTRARERLLGDPDIVAPITVVHTSVDIGRFPVQDRAPVVDRPLRLLYLGSLQGRYLGPQIFRFLRVALQIDPLTRCRVLTLVDREIVHRYMAEAGLDVTTVELSSAQPVDVPGLIAQNDAGIFMLQEALSNIATSATKVGEYLACGLPVVLTPRCGDLDQIVAETRTGVVIARHDDDAYAEAFQALRELLRDPDLARRCRAVAEETMGLRATATAQARVHRAALAAAPRCSLWARTTRA